MGTLFDWNGKVDDTSISYDIGVPTDNSLTIGYGRDAVKLPVMVYTEADNLQDISDVVWEKKVKKADRTDYLIAVGCGAISGLIDIFYVGEFTLERAESWGKEDINKFVLTIAKITGYKGDDLSRAIAHLEDKYPFAADAAKDQFGGGKQHHLRDFSHHFSLGGLICSIYTQFSGKVLGYYKKEGEDQIQFGAYALDNVDCIGRNFAEKVLFGTLYWFFHMVSDMAGTNQTAGKGTGIPGPVIALIEEVSALPCFKDKRINEKQLFTWVAKLFNGTLLGKHDENGKIKEARPFDLRTEIGLLHEVGRELVPIIVNECLVRALYFLRRLCLAIQKTEIHSIKDLDKINHAELLPYNNRAIRRMVTVSSGTFTSIDIGHALVRAAIENQAINAQFLKDFAVRVNVAGVGRFVIACKSDIAYIFEDIHAAREEKDELIKGYEKTVVDLQCLELNYEQLRALYSIERLMIADDISITKNEQKKAQKEAWKDTWEENLLDSITITDEAAGSYFLPEEQVCAFLDACDPQLWHYLIGMEAMLFEPYYPIYKTKEENNELKKLKFKSSYLTRGFPDKQKAIKKKDISALKRAYNKAGATLTGSTKNIVLGAVGTTVVVLASGGLSFFFAPAIATALVGESAAGLSGAALVSYSLAAVGGGSLAAGGLGMAGGTAIITGGGALIGMLGGTGVSAATTVNLLSQDSYVLSECRKLLAFSESILAKKYLACEPIAKIHASISERIGKLEGSINEFSEKVALDKEEKKELKNKLKAAEKSMKYLKRCEKGLHRLLEPLLKLRHSSIPQDEFSWALSRYEKAHPDVKIDTSKVWAAFYEGMISENLYGIEKYLNNNQEE